MNTLIKEIDEVSIRCMTELGRLSEENETLRIQLNSIHQENFRLKRILTSNMHAHAEALDKEQTSSDTMKEALVRMSDELQREKRLVSMLQIENYRLLCKLEADRE
jgi:hypothetical protein